ncbi:MAG: CheR family methyltransferase [Phycisphaerales bacterium]
MNPLERIGRRLRVDAHIDEALAAPAAIGAIVEERRRALRLTDVREYASLVERSHEELDRLRSQIAVPETWLFRYPASFDLLRARLLREGATRLRALSVGSATGAEACSIVATALAAGVPAEAVTVVGIDPNTCAVAQDGVLTSLAVRGGLPEWAQGDFAPCSEGVRVSPRVLARLELRTGAAPAALEPLEPGSFDAVFCRNLAIYLGDEARRAIGARLEELLAPQGVLFLGHAEPPGIFGLGQRFAPAEGAAPGSFAFERATARAGEPAPARPSAGSDAARAPAAATRTAPASARAHERTAHDRAAHGRHGHGRHANARPAHAEPPTLAQARAAADAGRLDDALAIASALHARGDREVALLELLGTVHAARGDLARAEELLRQVVYLEPGHPEALLQLAVCAEARGDLPAARRYRDRAAKEAR